ncbi:LysR family transcriptional regulator [Variovorax paradoxus]|jgi:DNA-binding transcriptional LysR family regulator|uniref:LysR family transcriptional regulator n=2 Tax=Comamonadaceae TaxID=80864 RepID=UPI0006E4AFA6|nr:MULTISPECIES: LysR family transcriptional regulator [unclassified Variovorax]KPU91637.1 LysR family transcriptional regulator [Variovorax paradoxus]KPV00987.1 LysR family transcriptional regulator [Variovorax paradoxus]KPV03544.1 LysR family transcriptional regulator [Variovorax paradoxus]KPV18335.1 LysR family transcriptional regulator [Variovorax paradoxus]KPV26994.1 LysR family transcriptional regulator [Variovorax paradoxus]
MRPDLDSLALFLRAVECGSLSKAAAESHMVLSAASRRIAMLESQFGVTLFQRSSRGVTVTGAGESLAVHARLILRDVDRMRADLSDYAQGATGRVRLQANASAMGQFLPDDVASFRRAYPEIRVDVEEHRSVWIVQAIRERQADVGVITGETSDASLNFIPYRMDRLVAVVHRRHPHRGREVSFEQLLDFDFVGLESDSAIARTIEDAAALARKVLRLRVQVKSFEAVCRMIEAGMGVGILPEGAAATYRKEMGLRFLNLTDAWASRRMYICTRQETLGFPQRRLVDHLLARSVAPVTSSGR